MRSPPGISREGNTHSHDLRMQDLDTGCSVVWRRKRERQSLRLVWRRKRERRSLRLGPRFILNEAVVS